MQNRSVISRTFNLLLAGIILFISVWSKAQVPVYESVAPKQEQKPNSPQKAPQTVVSEMLPMATVAPVVLDFQQDFFLLPSPIPVFIEKLQKLSIFSTKPLFSASYLEALFEHYISPNAP